MAHVDTAQVQTGGVGGPSIAGFGFTSFPSILNLRNINLLSGPRTRSWKTRLKEPNNGRAPFKREKLLVKWAKPYLRMGVGVSSHWACIFLFPCPPGQYHEHQRGGCFSFPGPPRKHHEHQHAAAAPFPALQASIMSISGRLLLISQPSRPAS